jgi:biotin operon repressor
MARRRKSGSGVDATGRSKGEGQYAPLSYPLLNSLAWRSLSGAAVKVFLELRTRFHGANNGQLILSLEESRRLLGIGKATVLISLDELQRKGFVVRTRRGQWYGRLASTWAVTDQRVDGSPAANTWKSCDAATIDEWKRLLKSRRKTKRGSQADPSASTTGRRRNREHFNGSALEPVKAIRLVAVGSGMDR